jgi:hypothetical protein
MLVGVGWLLALAWAYLVMSGISTPIVPYIFWYYGTRGGGPTLLIFGPILILNQAHQRLGLVLVIIGCALLTYFWGSTVVDFFHVEPLQAKPDYIDYTIECVLVTVALIADFLAFNLYRSICRGSE